MSNTVWREVNKVLDTRKVDCCLATSEANNYPGVWNCEEVRNEVCSSVCTGGK